MQDVTSLSPHTVLGKISPPPPVFCLRKTYRFSLFLVGRESEVCYRLKSMSALYNCFAEYYTD